MEKISVYDKLLKRNDGNQRSFCTNFHQNGLGAHYVDYRNRCKRELWHHLRNWTNIAVSRV